MMFAAGWASLSFLVLNCVAALLLPLAIYRFGASMVTSEDARLATGNGLAIDLEARAEKAALAIGAKCEFLADMSHHLRAPMNAVIGYSEMLIDDLNERGSESPELTKVHELGNVALARINDILDFSKLKMGRLPPFPEEVLLEDLLGDVSDLRQAAKRNDNAFSIQTAEGTRAVEIDIRKVQLIVRHAFAAINALVQGGTVQIAVRVVEDRLKCLISGDQAKSDTTMLKDAFDIREQSCGFPDGWEASRLGFVLVRELTAFLGGSSTFTKHAKAARFALDLPSHLSRAGGSSRAATNLQVADPTA